MPRAARNTRRIHAQVNMPLDYHLRKGIDSQDLVLLLHGYSQSGAIIQSLLESVVSPSASVLAPNALFPLPKRREGKKPHYGYSWYVYDFLTQEYVMDMRYAIEFLKNGLNVLGLSNRRITLIGFSQGGYLAPLLAEELDHVSQVIGIGCEFLHDELKATPSYPLVAIHGELDEVVRLEEARRGIEALTQKGISATLHSLPLTGHEINEAVRDQVAGLLKPHVS